MISVLAAKHAQQKMFALHVNWINISTRGNAILSVLPPPMHKHLPIPLENVGFVLLIVLLVLMPHFV